MGARFSVPHALEAYLAEQAAQAFAWSGHNCCHFVAGWVRTATGYDPMHNLPPTPDLLAARRLIRRLGGSLSGAWTSRLGREPIRPEAAQTGDIVLVHLADPDGAAVGICNGRHAALLTERDGVTMLPMAHARLAWRLQAEGGA